MPAIETEQDTYAIAPTCPGFGAQSQSQKHQTKKVEKSVELLTLL